MSRECDKYQELFTELSHSESAVSSVLAAHLKQCRDCQAFVEALGELDSAMNSLPELDAPDELVGRVLHQAEKLGKKREFNTKKLFQTLMQTLNSINFSVILPRGRMFGYGLATAMVAVLTLMSVTFLGQEATVTFETVGYSLKEGNTAGSGGTFSESEYDDKMELTNKGNKKAAVRGPLEKNSGYYANYQNLPQSAAAPKPEDKAKWAELSELPINRFRREERTYDGREGTDYKNQDLRADGISYKKTNPKDLGVFGFDGSTEVSSIEIDSDYILQDEIREGKAVVSVLSDFVKREAQMKASSLPQVNGAELQSRDIGEMLESADDAEQERSNAAFGLGGVGDRLASVPPRKSTPLNSAQLAADFLNRRLATSDLTFKDPTGYWSNSYVPGDPELRLLQMKLAAYDRNALEAVANQKLLLDDAARQPLQPFDVPRNSALALYVSSDQKAVEGPSRALVQIGIRATDKHGAQRPAMNIGLVIDARGEVDTATAAAIRALVTEFNSGKNVGDTFSLIAAGETGGVLVTSEEFKYGKLQVALEKLFSKEKASTAPQSLFQATKAAIEHVARVDDPTKPLGSSAVIVLATQPFGTDSEQLVRMAHQSAVSGIPVSVIGVGARFDATEIKQLILAGQGSQRVVASAAEAKGAVERELASVSRAVARAIRLHIKLAPEVKLVSIIDSERLDEVQSERARAAEKSIDLRLSRNLGIESDRGEDDEGVQIIIPTFYAGDSHVVLLDVLVPGPGKVADVTVRYKDLSYLNNGVARNAFSLSEGKQEKTAIELNVFKNFLSVETGSALQAAGKLLRLGDERGTKFVIERHRALLQGLTKEIPALGRDADITRDLNMLNEYILILERAAGELGSAQSFLADSLSYAGRLKTLPRPVSS